MTDFPVMPDFLAGLEVELRAAARRPASTSRRATGRRVVLALAVMAAMTTAFVLAIGAGGRQGTAAFAGPLILRESAVPVPHQFRTLGGGALYAQLVNAVGRDRANKDFGAMLQSGHRLKTQSARQIPAFGGTAYLLGAPGVWCLTAPDPAASQPDVEVGMTCVPAREFARIGIALTLGPHYVAALPQGVPDPVLHHADGTATALKPDEHGLVVVETLKAGETVIRADNAGHTTGFKR
jgi:hypothetical protein